MKIKVGDKAFTKKAFSLEDVKQFAGLSGDINPVHLDEQFAAQTLFKKPIVHGLLYSSLISALLANELPGPGSIYLHQELNFKIPLYHNEEVTAVVEVTEINPEKNIYFLKTLCYKNETELILEGKAIIKLIS